MDKTLNSDIFISVILPVYNCEKYVGESIESILNQTHKNFELIIINDGSTDGSDNKIVQFKDQRIQYLKLQKNEGFVNALNIGIKNSTGKYIFRMDADDICLVTRFEAQIAFLEKNPGIDILGNNAIFFSGKESRVTGSGNLNDAVIKNMLLLFSPFIHPTIVLRNSTIKKKYILYNNILSVSEDYDLFTRGSSQMTFAHSDSIVLKYREHESVDRITNNKTKSKATTLMLRAAYFSKLQVKISEDLLIHYEDLFYSDCIQNKAAATKTLEFYRIIDKYYIENSNTEDYKLLRQFVKNSYLSHFYQFSKVGVSVLPIYWQGRELGRYTPIEEMKFIIKSFLKK